MPSSETILIGLTAIANDWRWLAITWHVLLAALLVTIVAGWRPSPRVMGYLLVAPLVSVSLIAWLTGNPFNGTVFTILAVILVRALRRSSTASVQLGSLARVLPAVVVIGYGWTYPHFVDADSWTTYLYASPFGVVPCPTLSVVIGLTLAFQNLCSRAWSTTLVLAGLLYGTIGVFTLGVLLDWGLLFAAAALAVLVVRTAGWRFL